MDEYPELFLLLKMLIAFFAFYALVINMGIKRIIKSLITWSFKLQNIIRVKASKNYTQSSNFANGKFINKYNNSHSIGIISFFRAIMKSSRGHWPDYINNKERRNLAVDNNQVSITFVNHATFLIEIQGFRIIIDPMFAKIAGPLNLFGAKRRRDPGLYLSELPPIDMILITHNHYDHLDLFSINQILLNSQPRIIVPLGDKSWLNQYGIKNIVEMDWWQIYQIGNIKINFLPAQHSSRRGLFDKDKSLWGSYLIESKFANIFHSGDTGYSDHFKDIGNKFKIDISMITIGDYKPDILNYLHMSPTDALKAHEDLKSKRSIAMHHETFRLSATGYREAEEELRNKIISTNSQVEFTIPEVGDSYHITETADSTNLEL